MSDVTKDLERWLSANSIRAQKGSESPSSVLQQAAAITLPPAPAAPAESEESENLPKITGGFVRYPISRPENDIRIDLTKLDLPAGGDEVTVGAQRLREALQGVVVGSPEDLAALKRRNERLTKDLEEAYREIAALRRLTAGTGRHPGAKYYETMGRCLELDADGLSDLVDRYELPEEVQGHLREMSANLSQFSMNCMAYAQTLS